MRLNLKTSCCCFVSLVNLNVCVNKREKDHLNLFVVFVFEIDLPSSPFLGPQAGALFRNQIFILGGIEPFT